ncbi:MAG: DUF4153 domain-containing protein [Acetivibrionales bacterium]
MDKPVLNESTVESKNMTANENIIKRENICLLVATLVLGILFDVLFYDKPLGVSYPIFIIAFYSVMMWNLRRNLRFRPDFGWLLSVPVLLLSLTYFIFSNRIFMPLNFMAIPVLVVTQTTLISGNGKYKWYNPSFIGDILYGFFYRPFAYFAKPFVLLAAMVHSKTNLKKYNAVIKILMGLLISIPLMLVIILLLASADQVFEHFIGELPDLFRNINVSNSIACILIASIVTLSAFSYIWSLINTSNSKTECVPAGVKTERKKWDALITITILAMINTVYVFFTIIQFSYLFGGFSYALPDGFTYAEYARKGFFELVVVTLINFSVLLGLLNFTKTGSKAINRAKRIMYSLLVLCTLVMLFSAHFRMSLYEKAYGYTYLRVLTHAFMAFLFVLFIITLYRIWREEVSLLKPYIITSIAAFVLINYINIDVIIAANNINRYYNTGKIDTNYLRCLSYDAVPQLVRLLNDEDESVSESIENYLYNIKEELDRPQPWQSFNISKHRAKKILSGYELEYNKQ